MTQEKPRCGLHRMPQLEGMEIEHLLPESLAERLIQYLADHILWDMEPGYTRFNNERLALLAALTGEKEDE